MYLNSSTRKIPNQLITSQSKWSSFWKKTQFLWKLLDCVTAYVSFYSKRKTCLIASGLLQSDNIIKCKLLLTANIDTSEENKLAIGCQLSLVTVINVHNNYEFEWDIYCRGVKKCEKWTWQLVFSHYSHYTLRYTDKSFHYWKNVLDIL